MIEKNYNQSWKFWVDKDAFALVWDIPEAARNVTLPHDAMIEGIAKADSRNQGSTGYRDGCVCNYVKLLNVSEEDKNKTMVLKFEGVYMVRMSKAGTFRSENEQMNFQNGNSDGFA